MNLPRLRSNQWTELIKAAYLKYKDILQWGDQDIINAILYHRRDLLYVFHSSLHVVSTCCFCVFSETAPMCQGLLQNGAKFLHGFGNVFTQKDETSIQSIIFMHVYHTLKSINLTTRFNGQNLFTKHSFLEVQDLPEPIGSHWQSPFVVAYCNKLIYKQLY